MWKQDEQAGGEHNIPDDGWWQLRPVGSSRGGAKWPNLGYILTIWLTIFRDGSDVGCERRVKVKGDSTFFGLSNWKATFALS